MATAVKTSCPSLKHLTASVIFVDPPFGFDVALWDAKDKVWTTKYWKAVLESLKEVSKPGTLLVLFADPVAVLPSFMAALASYNELAQRGSRKEWKYANQVVFNKTNYVAKSSGPYAHSVETAFLFYYEKIPKISKLRHELAGNYVSAAKLSSKLTLPVSEGEQPNPCQKPNLWLQLLLENHVADDSYVMDLTAGSLSSAVATFLVNSPIHWVGADNNPNVLANFKQLVDLLVQDSDWWIKFKNGKTFK